MRRVAVLATCFLELAMLAACGSAGGGSSAPASARCSPASSSLLAKIMEGVDVRPGGRLRSGYVVQSTESGNVKWGPHVVVAAEIDGAGLEGTGDIGVWATYELTTNFDGSSIRPGHWSIYAVNELAKQLGLWGDGSEIGLHFPISADGVAEAMACAQAG